MLEGGIAPGQIQPRGRSCASGRGYTDVSRRWLHLSRRYTCRGDKIAPRAAGRRLAATTVLLPASMPRHKPSWSCLLAAPTESQQACKTQPS
jgi:hypothetical protein